LRTGGECRAAFPAAVSCSAGVVMLTRQIRRCCRRRWNAVSATHFPCRPSNSIRLRAGKSIKVRRKVSALSPAKKLVCCIGLTIIYLFSPFPISNHAWLGCGLPRFGRRPAQVPDQIIVDLFLTWLLGYTFGADVRLAKTIRQTGHHRRAFGATVFLARCTSWVPTLTAPALALCTP